jgi:hypothetical protein
VVMYCRVRDIEWSCIAVLEIPSDHVWPC